MCGLKMAKRPARMSRMLRAMDQLMAFPATSGKGVDALLMRLVLQKM
jgi:hypothetical protein